MASHIRSNQLISSWTTGHCSTGKRAFQSRQAGKLASKSAVKSGMGHLRVYLCHECQAWHIGHLKQI